MLQIGLRPVRSVAKDSPILEPVFVLTTPKMSGLHMDQEVLAEKLKGRFFAPGSEKVLSENCFQLNSIRRWKFSGLQVAPHAHPAQIEDSIKKRKFPDKPFQLLAAIVTAIEQGKIPLPQPEDTARMVLPFVEIAITRNGPFKGQGFIGKRSFLFSPVGGTWKVERYERPDLLQPGDLCLCAEKG